MEAKQHAIKQPVDQLINQGRNRKKHLETNENENKTYQNLWNTAKAALGGKFTIIWAYLKKQEKSQINNLTLYLKELRKKEQSQSSRKKKIIKIKANNK